MLIVLIGGATLLATRLIIVPLRSPMGRSQMANLVERRYPHLASSLISAVQFSMGQVGAAESNSREMVRAVVAGAGARATGLDFDAVLDSKRQQQACHALLAVGALITLGVFLPQQLRVGVQRNLLLSNVEWPRRTKLIVNSDAGEIIAARGDDVEIEASAEGVQPRSVEIFYTTADGEQARESMFTVGSAGDYRYRFTVKAVEQDFAFYLEGGDDRTKLIQVRLVDRPQVVAATITVTPPAYSGLKEFKLGEGQRATEALPGSRIRLAVTTNKPVASATLMSGTERIVTAAIDEYECAAEFDVQKSTTLHFALEDETGLANRRPVRFSVRARKDDAPRVRLILPGVGDMVTPEAVLPMEISVRDTYGIADVMLRYQLLREGEKERFIDLPTFDAGSKSFFSTVNWPLSAAAAQPGDRLSIQAEAGDYDDVSGPNQARSAEHTIRVVTRDELLAELARREQEYRQSFERILDNQEQVRGRLLSVQSSVDADSSSTIAALADLERRNAALPRR